MEFVSMLIIVDKQQTNMMSELLEIRNQFEELQKKYQDYLPKVDPKLIYDLLVRQQEDPLNTPMYMSEVFTRRGIDPQNETIKSLVM
jgi:hypothetical protein